MSFQYEKFYVTENVLFLVIYYVSKIERARETEAERMKEAKRVANFILVIVLCLSMRMNVLANETKCSEDNTNISTVEVEHTQVIMPRYTANTDFSEIPVSHATHGNKK